MHHQVTLITNTAPRTIDDVRKKRDGTSRRSTESASSTRVNSRFRFEAHHTGRSNNQILTALDSLLNRCHRRADSPKPYDARAVNIMHVIIAQLLWPPQPINVSAAQFSAIDHCIIDFFHVSSLLLYFSYLSPILVPGFFVSCLVLSRAFLIFCHSFSGIIHFSRSYPRRFISQLRCNRSNSKESVMKLGELHIDDLRIYVNFPLLFPFFLFLFTLFSKNARSINR